MGVRVKDAMRRCRRCREPFPVAQLGRRRLYCSDVCRSAARRQRSRGSVHFSSETAEWATPQDVFDELNAEFVLGATVVCLVPARTDTRWWQDCCTAGEVRFVRGRLRFGGTATGAPFPSAVVVFRDELRDVSGVTEGVTK
jgi:hypothetical protein